MKRIIQLYIPAVLLLAWQTGSAQQAESVLGTPATTQRPSAVRTLQEMEQSPLNMRIKGPVQQNLQGLKKAEEEAEDAPELNLTVTEDQASKTVPFIIDESAEANFISSPPVPDLFESLTNLGPARTYLANQQDGWIPSDAQGAAGPNHLVFLANGDARIINKQTGAIISNLSLDAFFGWSSVFDPRIFYDPYNNRWVALGLKGASGAADSKFRLQISYNSDPTQGWYYYEIDEDATNTCWLDFAMLGFNKDWIIVSGNTPGCGAGKPGIYAFDKVQAYAGGTVNYNYWNPVGNLAPAFTYDNSLANVWFVRTYNGNSGGQGYCQLYNLTGSPPGGATLTAGALVSSSLTWQGNASVGGKIPEQLGSATKFDFVTVFGASMYSNAVYRNGSLWFTHPVFLPATGTNNRTSTQWWQINPSAATVTQVGRIDDGSGTVCTFYPSIAVNNANDAVVSYCIFSPNYYQSAAYNYRNAGDPLGLVPNGVFYAGGGSINTSTRTGDYGATVVDPIDDKSIWAVNQISGPVANLWETYTTLIPSYYGCYTNATFGNSTWYGNTKNEASGSITSAEMLSGSSIVDYDAGTFVDLKPGFVANQGVLFKAYINGCGGSLKGLGSGDKYNPVVADNNVSALRKANVTLKPALRVAPNPTNDVFRFNYNIDEPSQVSLRIYDVNMKLVSTIINNDKQQSGVYEITMDTRSLPAGIYFGKLESNSFTQTVKLVVLKD